MPSDWGVASGKLLKIDSVGMRRRQGPGCDPRKTHKACRSACDEIGYFRRIRFVQECRHAAFGVAGSLVAGDRAHELGRRDILAGRKGDVTSREPDRWLYRVWLALIRHRRSNPFAYSPEALLLYPFAVDIPQAISDEDRCVGQQSSAGTNPLRRPHPERSRLRSHKRKRAIEARESLACR
jgi:hypothetical protein